MKNERTVGGVASARKTKFLMVLTASSILASWGGQAFADDSASIRRLEAEIQRIEARHQQEISALKSEIRHLRHGGGPIYVTKGEPLPAGPGPHVIETTKAGVHFGFADADNENTVELTGRLHIDTGGYPGWRPNNATERTSRPGLAGGINFRRARIGVQGIFLGDWAYGLIFDMGGTNDGFAGAFNSNTGVVTNGITSGIENAFITYNGLYKHGGPFPVAFDIGAIDVPWTLDEPMGSNDIMFMERSSSQVVATLFGGGDNRTALGFRSNNDRYWLGAYLTGPQTGAEHVVATTGNTAVATGPNVGLGPQLAGLVRATYQLYQDKTNNASLHIGVNYAYTFDPRSCNTSINVTNASIPSGTTGAVTCNASGLTLSDRPELRIDPTQFLNTGFIPAHAGQVIGGEAAASYGNAFIQGEYYHYIVDTKNETTVGGIVAGTPGPSVAFNGGYVQGSYTFGGRRYYKPTTGAYSGVIPDHPFILGTGGWGALEVAGRFSIVDLNAAAPFLAGAAVGSGTRGGAILGGEQTAYGAGANWYPNGNLKFMLDYEHVIADIPATLGGPSTKGGTIDWIAARSEFFF